MTINRHDYNTLLGGAMESPDMDTYIAEWGTSSIFYPDPDDPGPEVQEVVDTLTRIWEVAHITIKDLVAAAGGKMTHLASRFGIPYRTIQDWASGQRQCPGYTLRMMAELLGLAKAQVTD